MPVARSLAAAALLTALPAIASADTPRSAPEAGALPDGAVGAADPVRPRGIYIWAPGAEDQAPVPAADPALRAPTIVYMNRLGGIYSPGYSNDAARNVSTIVSGTSEVPAWDIPAEDWQFVMDCVTDQFERFNVVVTDEDPGDVPHIESVVAGYPQHVGMSRGVGGVSPFTCGVIDRSIVFTFAEVYGNALQEVCHTAAQEIAHSFGLDHELLCADPMTYLGGCGPKTFQDRAAPCGEFQQRACSCGGDSQNSVQMMFDRLGPADRIAPEMAIDEPRHGDLVDAGFRVAATATDDKQVDRVDLFVDGDWAGVAPVAPYEFDTDATLASGMHVVEVVVTDGLNEVSELIQVRVRGDDFPDSCDGRADCPSGFACDGGACEPEGALYPPRETGAYCATNGHCDSGLCLSDGRDSRCTQLCEPGDEASCPGDLGCLDTNGSESVCWPKPPADRGGCSVGGGAGAGAWLLGLALLALRRRR